MILAGSFALESLTRRSPSLPVQGTIAWIEAVIAWTEGIEAVIPPSAMKCTDSLTGFKSGIVPV